jgi:hypothetical protein
MIRFYKSWYTEVYYLTIKIFLPPLLIIDQNRWLPHVRFFSLLYKVHWHNCRRVREMVLQTIYSSFSASTKGCWWAPVMWGSNVRKKRGPPLWQYRVLWWRIDLTRHEALTVFYIHHHCALEYPLLVSIFVAQFEQYLKFKFYQYHCIIVYRGFEWVSKCWYETR